MAWSRRSVLGVGGLAAFAALGGCAGRDDGVLRIGATATGAPFSFAGPDGRTLVGAMVDIGQAVATQAGYSAVVETTPFAALIPSLVTRKIDVIAAAMLRTPEREEVVAFSDPVYEYGGGLVVRLGDAGVRYAALADLRGKRVAVQIGTRFVDQLTQAGVSNTKTYDTLADCMRDLANGRVDVVYGDAPILKHQVASNAVPGLRVVDGFVAPAMEQVCLVLRKDEPEMLARLNTAIATLKTREIARIVGEWGLQ